MEIFNENMLYYKELLFLQTKDKSILFWKSGGTLTPKYSKGKKLLPRRFQFGGLSDNYLDLSSQFLFDPRVYAGKKENKSEANMAAMWKKAKPFYDEMIKRGVNPYIAVGVLGNIALESGFDPNASNGTHFGYTQNETKARNWIHTNYGGYGHKHQMNFLIDGLTGKLKGNLNDAWGREFIKRFNGFIKATQGSKNIDTITHLWEKHYERSGGLANSKRTAYANYFARQLGLIS